MSIINPSPRVKVNGVSSHNNGVDIAFDSNNVIFQLEDYAGVNVWTLECIGTDETNVAQYVNEYLSVYPTSDVRTLFVDQLRIAYGVDNLNHGTALIFRSTVNGGIDINGRFIESYVTTFGVYILTEAVGFLSPSRVGAVNETVEGDREFGWTSKINAMLREDTNVAGGDLSGSYPNPTVVGIQGISISDSHPAVGAPLIYSSDAGSGVATFQPLNLSDYSGASYTGELQLEGDVVGYTSHSRVAGLQLNPVKEETLGSDQDGYGLVWNNSNGQWEATALASSPFAGGDLDGNYPNPTVVAIQGNAVSNTAPTSGYALIWNGSAWAPGAIPAIVTWADDLSTSTNSHQYIDQISGSSGAGGTVTGKFTTLNFNQSGVTDYYVKGFDNTNAAPGNIRIQGGAFFGTATNAIGGHVYLQGGTFNDTGVFRKGGDGYVLGGAVAIGAAGGTEGGDVHLLGGDASNSSGGSSGNVWIGSPNQGAGNSGFINMTTGSAGTANTSGSITIQTGSVGVGGTIGSIFLKTSGSNTRLSINGAGTINIPGLSGSGNGFVTVNTSGDIGFTTLTASGDLSGTYPAPTVIKINGTSVPASPSANQVLVATSGTVAVWSQITDGYVSSSAAIAYSKLNLSNSIVNADVNSSAAIAYSKLNLSGSIVNADVNASAAIAYSKLALSNSIVNADINSSAAIAYSKLNLSTSIVNADINASAAIAYSKLNLSGSIVNADVSSSASLAVSKLAAGTAGQILINSSTPTPTWKDVTGDITLSPLGVVEVTDIRGNAVKSESLGAVNDGYILTWVDANDQWEAKKNLSAVTFAGDLSGTTTSQSVIKINGNPVSNTSLGATQDGYVLTWVDGSGEYQAKPNTGGPPTGTAGGNLSGSYPNPTVAKINGVSVNATPSADTVLVATSGTASSWSKIVNANVDAAAAIAYSKLNLSGSIVNADVDAAAAIAYSKLNLGGGIIDNDINSSAAISVNKLAAGSAGQVLLNNSGPTPTWTTIGGDATVSASGVVAVTKINGNPVSSSSNGSAQDGYILTWVNGSSEYQAKPAPVSFTAGGDLTGSNTSQQVVNLTGSGGVVTTADSVTTLSFTTTAAFGTPQNITIKQSDNLSANPCGTFTLQAQSLAGGTGDGGNLILRSGSKSGVANDGDVLIKTGTTTRLTINDTGVITIANLSTGIVHADSSGNLTSSALVNADVDASAAIAYSKLNLSGSIVNADVSSSAAIAVSKLAPGTSAQILLSSGTPTATWTTISGDISITNSGVVAVQKLQGNAVENAALGSGEDQYVLTWVDANNQWEAQPNAAGVTFAGDLSGSSSSQTVIAIRGNAVKNQALGAGQDTYVLTWVNANSQWEAQPATGGGGGVTTVGTIDSQTKSANGAVISGANIYMQTADATHPGLMSETTQTIAGDKTFSGATTLSALGTGLVHSGSGGALTSSLLVNADVSSSAAIAYSKLNLAASIVNADIASGAAIAYNKLNLATSIVNADVNASAAIAGTKISPDFGSQNVVTTGTLTVGSSSNKSTYLGGRTVSTFTCNSSLTLGDGYYQVFVDTSAARSITLPAPADGREFWITDVIGTANTNNITLVRNGSEKINGVTASKVLQTNWGSWRVISNGTDWFVM